MTVAEAILQTLAGAGVRTTFGLPGVHNLGFWEARGDRVPEIIGTRHEQTTVYAADGLARASGGLGVSLTTTGPGAANAVGAFGEAAASGSPVLLVSSDTSTRIARAGVVRGGLHESTDQGAIFGEPGQGDLSAAHRCGGGRGGCARRGGCDAVAARPCLCGRSDRPSGPARRVAASRRAAANGTG